MKESEKNLSDGAFSQFVTRFRPSILNYLNEGRRWLSIPRHSKEDVTQNVLLYLFKYREENPWAWDVSLLPSEEIASRLFQIVNRQAVNWIRRETAKKRGGGAEYLYLNDFLECPVADESTAFSKESDVIVVEHAISYLREISCKLKQNPKQSKRELIALDLMIDALPKKVEPKEAAKHMSDKQLKVFFETNPIEAALPKSEQLKLLPRKITTSLCHLRRKLRKMGTYETLLTD